MSTENSVSLAPGVGVAHASDSPAVRGVRLKRLRYMANLSRDEMHSKYALNKNTLKGWELGRHSGITEKKAYRLVEIFLLEGVHTTIDWLLYGIGSGPTLVDQEQSSLLDLSAVFSRVVADKQVVKELLFFRKSHPDAIDFIVEDDGMEPCYSFGEVVAGRKRFGSACRKLIGLDCIVQTQEGKVMLRRLHHCTAQGTYTLLCSNNRTTVLEPALYNVALVSAAPVMWRRSQDNCSAQSSLAAAQQVERMQAF